MANKKITELPAATLPIVAGVKFEAVQGGVNVQVDADDMPGSGGSTLDQIEVATAGGTITLDFDSKIERMFVGGAPFATPKTIAFDNDTVALLGQFVFDISNIAAVLTFPSDVIMQGSDSRWDAGAFEFTPDATGKHQFSISWDGTNWILLAAGGSGGGGGGGAVASVNGQTGTVVLDAGDVGADPAGSAAAAQAASQPTDGDLTAIAGLSPSNDDVIQRKSGAWTNRTMAQLASDLGVAAAPKILVIACSDEITPITAAANKVKFRMPYAMTVSEVRASLSTAQTSGSIFTVDIHESGTTILSTKLTIDNTETTSTTAAAAAVISDTALADNAEITIDVDQIGDNTAKGLKVTIIGA
jgi:hypothetical protein